MVKLFHFTKTQEFPSKVKIFCYEENTGLLLRSNVARHPATKQVKWFKVEMVTMADATKILNKEIIVSLFLIFLRDKFTIWILI